MPWLGPLALTMLPLRARLVFTAHFLALGRRGYAPSSAAASLLEIVLFAVLHGSRGELIADRAPRGAAVLASAASSTIAPVPRTD